MTATPSSFHSEKKRTDYQPPCFQIDTVNLEFDLTPQTTTVRSTLNIRCLQKERTLILQGEELTLDSLLLNDTPLTQNNYRLGFNQLEIFDVPASFTLTSVCRISPEKNTSLMGLYQSQDHYFTQCEPEGFRRITWFIDRPDVMSRYRVTLRADAATCPILLSNGNLIASGVCSSRAGWHWATWEDPFPKPCYLFALVAGNFVAREETFVTPSKRSVLLQVWSEVSHLPQTAYALTALKEAIRWDEQRFGLELDLDRFMIVAADDFNAGAMENKGLNIFNSKYILAHTRTATDDDFSAVESVIGHEYFHNWTGNRVTCRDWFQLTLKEGLTVFRDQEFSADQLAARAPNPSAAQSARAVKRIIDAQFLRTYQFAEDAGPMAHPIRPDSYKAISNFYTVTVYEKGAEIIRMLQTLVGKTGLEKGLSLYLHRHDGQAVTCEDFLKAVGDANQRNLDDFSRWYSQTGTPSLQVTGHYDAQARQYTLKILQHIHHRTTDDATSKDALWIPLALGLVGPDGKDIPFRLAGTDVPAPNGTTTQHTVVLSVKSADETIVLENVPSPPTPSLLRGFSAPLTVHFPYTTDEIAFLAKHDTDPFNQWESVQKLFLLCIKDAVAKQMNEPTTPPGGDANRRLAVLVDVFQHILTEKHYDCAWTSQALKPPSESFIAEQFDIVDPAAIRQGLLQVRQHLAKALPWSENYQIITERIHQQTPSEHPLVGAGDRSLQSTVLAYWIAQPQNEAAVQAAQQQLDTAQQMTLKLSALQALLQSDSPLRSRALEQFAAQFTDDRLVLDKWFSLQATMHRQLKDPPVIQQVQRLCKHPAFSLKNPNRVRALIGGFCHHNLAEFHAQDSSGYRFLAEQLLMVDALNPHSAARLARAFDIWPKLESSRRILAQMTLQDLAKQPCSRDLSEIIERLLSAPRT